MNKLASLKKNEIVVYSDNVKRMTTEIKVIQDNVCRGMIEIGKRLIEIKKEVGHGNWLEYLDKELGYSVRTAQQLMKVYEEFGNTNTFSFLQSSKIIALLDIPQESREDFISNHNLEDSTVRQLKDEIKKYKEENGLLTQKQQQALEEKRRVEQETQRLKSQLEQEKNRQPKVEIKEVVKEKVIDNTDYALAKKVRQLEEDNQSLKRSKQVYEEAMNTYKEDSNKYQELKDRMFRMTCVNGGDVDEIKALDDINNLYISINKFIKTELSPVKYDNCMRFINSSEHITDSFMNMINVVEVWCSEMRKMLDKKIEDDNIIDVEGKWKNS